MNTSFFGELLSSIAERGRALIERSRERRGDDPTLSQDFVQACEELLSGRGEASGVARARDLLQRYSALRTGPRIAFFEALAHRFGPDPERLEKAIAAWRETPSDATASAIYRAAEPRRQELLRRLNLAPFGTSALVNMREHVLEAKDRRNDLSVVDADFVHLFTAWFNRGFLVLRKIDWSTPASILEKIIRYEAVHAIHDWDDLRRRIDSPDRSCYAFFHPALIDEPLIFVEVAYTREIPGAITPILAADREPLEPSRATTAVFYSISNCLRGLSGVSFGNFLIKQVVEDIRREMPRLTTFVTLSPVPGFADWLRRERMAETSQALREDDKLAFAVLDREDWWTKPELVEKVREPLMRAIAWYFLHAKTARGLPRDPVARFHLGNGARLERLDFLGDTSQRALRQAHGFMVNYQYDLDDIEKNHEAFAEQRAVTASQSIRRLAPAPARELVAAVG